MRLQDVEIGIAIGAGKTRVQLNVKEETSDGERFLVAYYEGREVAIARVDKYVDVCPVTFKNHFDYNWSPQTAGA